MKTRNAPARPARTPETHAFSGLRNNSSSTIGKVRVRHSYGPDGITYRGYVPSRDHGCSPEQRAVAGANLVKVKTLSGVSNVRLSRRTLHSLLKFSLAGPRARQVRVEEEAPGRFRVLVTYKSKAGVSMTLGRKRIDEDTATVLVPEAGLIRQLKLFALMESAFESGVLDPSEIHQVLATGVLTEDILAKTRAAHHEKQ